MAPRPLLQPSLSVLLVLRGVVVELFSKRVVKEGMASTLNLLKRGRISKEQWVSYEWKVVEESGEAWFTNPTMQPLDVLFLEGLSRSLHS